MCKCVFYSDGVDPVSLMQETAKLDSAIQRDMISEDALGGNFICLCICPHQSGPKPLPYRDGYCQYMVLG